MNFVVFLLNFVEILSEFHEELQKIAIILDIFTTLLEKFRKMLEISGFCEEFHSSVSLFSIHSLGRFLYESSVEPQEDEDYIRLTTVVRALTIKVRILTPA